MIRYRLAYITIGIAIMLIDSIISLEYPNILIYSWLGSFFGFFLPFGIGLSLLLYGLFGAKDYGVNKVIGIVGTGGFTHVRRNRISTKILESDHDILSGLPVAMKSSDGKIVTYSLFTNDLLGTTEYTKKLNEATDKYINGEIDDEGFYSYLGMRGIKEKKILKFIKKFKNENKSGDMNG